jgi:Protein of unknown function (DUF3302)
LIESRVSKDRVMKLNISNFSFPVVHKSHNIFKILPFLLLILAVFAPLPIGAEEVHEVPFEDKLADVLTWVVLVVAPVVGIVVFWLVHILPEKIAEKKEHPQAKAIQVLCLLSLLFGGLLWPLAWLWAYSKPVFYKMAYGTDKGKGHGEEPDEPAAQELKEVRERLNELSKKTPDASEIRGLVDQIKALEKKLAAQTGEEGGKI